jgi:hypothetical protein
MLHLEELLVNLSLRLRYRIEFLAVIFLCSGRELFFAVAAVLLFKVFRTVNDPIYMS